MTSIAQLADTDLCYVTTTGRRTGAPHRIEIWFVAHDDGAYLLTSDTADWYRNIEAHPEVLLEIGDARRTTIAQPVSREDPANDVVRTAMVSKYQPGYAGEDLSDWSREAALVRIEWSPDGD